MIIYSNATSENPPAANITDNELSDARNQLNQESSSSLNDIKYYYIQSYNELFMDNVMYTE